MQHSPFQLQLLEFIHSNPAVGHSGFHKTVHRAKADFYWKGMLADIKKFIRECPVCQVNKPETLHPPSLLQPLPVPSRVWSNISMDFIEGLPLSHGFSVILVVVDRFTKYGHFMALSHPYTAVKVAQVFLANVLKLYGIPLFPIGTRCLLLLFGGSFFASKAFLLLSAQPITLSQMVRLRLSTSVLRLICCVIRRPSPGNGILGFHWLNGGTIPTTILPLVLPPLKQCTSIHL